MLGMMRPYWITTSQPTGLGYGVTARSVDDAKGLLGPILSDDDQILTVEPVTDIGSLDQGHVVPNMGLILKRGVWFPLGYEHLAS
jgi:hypothetical protein